MGVIAAFAGLLLTIEINVFFPNQGGFSASRDGGRLHRRHLHRRRPGLHRRYLLRCVHDWIAGGRGCGHQDQRLLGSLVMGLIVIIAVVINVTIGEGQFEEIPGRIRRWFGRDSGNAPQRIGKAGTPAGALTALRTGAEEGAGGRKGGGLSRFERIAGSTHSRSVGGTFWKIKGEEKMKRIVTILAGLTLAAFALSACTTATPTDGVDPLQLQHGGSDQARAANRRRPGDGRSARRADAIRRLHADGRHIRAIPPRWPAPTAPRPPRPRSESSSSSNTRAGIRRR